MHLILPRFSPRFLVTSLPGATVAAALASGSFLGLCAQQPPSDPPVQLAALTVSSDLDRARAAIAPALGAATYTMSGAQIQRIGQGEDGPFQQVLLQAPGVVGDEFGEVHVRGDHGDLQYRINGVLLPEGLNGFAQEVDVRMIQSVTLLTGTLPAQFGDRTAGVIDVISKTGAQLNGGEWTLYGGADSTLQSSLQVGGLQGQWEYFALISQKHDNLGIDNPTRSSDALHDRTDQERIFGYLTYQIDATSRATFLLGISLGQFQIPDIPGLPATFALTGAPPADSAAANENQTERNDYAVASFQTSTHDQSLQVSGFVRSTDLDFQPDPVQDLLLSGVAGQADNRDWAVGLQADDAIFLGLHHTVRTGLLATVDDEQLVTRTAVFALDGSGRQISDLPEHVNDQNDHHGAGLGTYLQDEWSPVDRLTVNYGVRFDQFDASFDRESQLSPRLNLVWQPDDATSVHVGYARYFMPPTLQYLPPDSVQRFAGTSNAPLSAQDDPPKVERDHYFDAGWSWQFAPEWKITADSFLKFARNLLDDGQFGSAVIISNFNYRWGAIYGAELGGEFKRGALSAYGNISFVQTAARQVDSVQFEFPTDELAYIGTHDIPLDHQGRFTSSGGVTYAWTKQLQIYATLLYGDGLRSGFANREKLPAYGTGNLGIEQAFPSPLRGFKTFKVRLDCLNVLDRSYELRDGSGLGIAAPAYGARRAFYAGLSFAY